MCGTHWCATNADCRLADLQTHTSVSLTRTSVTQTCTSVSQTSTPVSQNNTSDRMFRLAMSDGNGNTIYNLPVCKSAVCICRTPGTHSVWISPGLGIFWDRTLVVTYAKKLWFLPLCCDLFRFILVLSSYGKCNSLGFCFCLLASRVILVTFPFTGYHRFSQLVNSSNERYTSPVVCWINSLGWSTWRLFAALYVWPGQFTLFIEVRL